MMGDKIQARKTAIANNVPVVPGTEKPVKKFSEVGRSFLKQLIFYGGYHKSILETWIS